MPLVFTNEVFRDFDLGILLSGPFRLLTTWPRYLVRDNNEMEFTTQNDEVHVYVGGSTRKRIRMTVYKPSGSVIGRIEIPTSQVQLDAIFEAAFVAFSEEFRRNDQRWANAAEIAQRQNVNIDELLAGKRRKRSRRNNRRC